MKLDHLRVIKFFPDHPVDNAIADASNSTFSLDTIALRSPGHLQKQKYMFKIFQITFEKRNQVYFKSAKVGFWVCH